MAGKIPRVWAYTPEPGMLVDGLLGDQNANRHTDKGGPNCPTGMTCVDFYLDGVATHVAGDGRHSVHAVTEPSSLALVSLALVAMMAGLGSRLRATRAFERFCRKVFASASKDAMTNRRGLILVVPKPE